MASRSSQCKTCGARTTSHTGFCQWCKSKRHHGYEQLKEENLVIDQAGGSWWIWDQRGDVLVAGKPTKDAAVIALGAGDVEESEAESGGGAKSGARLDREIAAFLKAKRP